VDLNRQPTAVGAAFKSGQPHSLSYDIAKPREE